MSKTHPFKIKTPSRDCEVKLRIENNGIYIWISFLLTSLFPIKMKARSALSTRNTAIKNGFLSNKINELKKNKTKDSSWTRISILKNPKKDIQIAYIFKNNCLTFSRIQMKWTIKCLNSKCLMVRLTIPQRLEVTWIWKTAVELLSWTDIQGCLHYTISKS